MTRMTTAGKCWLALFATLALCSMYVVDLDRAIERFILVMLALGAVMIVDLEREDRRD